MDPDTLRIVLPAITALVGAALGSLVGPLIARRTSLDTARLNLEGQRQLAGEAEARAELASERERRRELLEPLQAAARQQWRDVEQYLRAARSGSDAPLPSLSALQAQDVRWEAFRSKRLEAALNQFRVALWHVSQVLPDARELDPPDLPAHVIQRVYEFQDAVLSLEDAAADCIRDGPDAPQRHGLSTRDS